MTTLPSHIISAEQAGTLPGLFRERLRRDPQGLGYRDYDTTAETWKDTTWAEMAGEIARWQGGLEQEGLAPGERVAVVLRNCREWVMYDQAALGLGLVVVPLYTQDRAENAAYILQHSDARVLLIEGEEQWQKLQPVLSSVSKMQRIVTLHPIPGASDPRLVQADQWLPGKGGELRVEDSGPGELATIVYTSGTTGRPKGVMLSHRNILSDIDMGLQAVPLRPGELFLSFLPLSHTLERSAGYYLAMMAGATVAYARSIPQLREDLASQRPTVLVSVPRIYERIYGRLQEQLAAKPKAVRGLFQLAVDVGWRRFEYTQGRAPWHPSLLLWPVLDRLVASKVTGGLGGRLYCAISGGAALGKEVGKVFLALGVPLLQGYGLTETSPVISVCRRDDNVLGSIGPPLPGVTVAIGAEDELLTKGPHVMLGYWKDEEATRAMIDGQGWLHSGDKARQEDGRLYIIGRLKEIIVLANGEKVPPADMEMAIETDPLIDQIMIVGEGRPYLAALVVVAQEPWRELAKELGLDPTAAEALADPRVEEAVCARIDARMKDFPGYAKVRRVGLLTDPWTIPNGLLTPTMKIRRGRIHDAYRERIDGLYRGH